MKLIIDISERDYENISRIVDMGLGTNVDEAIKNGILLPKGHGRLIDADALEGHRQIQIVPCGNGKYTDITVYYQNDIDVAPTIIEADKESEDKGCI